VTRNMGVVQAKVTAISMLILKDFLKRRRAKIRCIFHAGFWPNRAR
jgi:hypothetical protein